MRWLWTQIFAPRAHVCVCACVDVDNTWCPRMYGQLWICCGRPTHTQRLTVYANCRWIFTLRLVTLCSRFLFTFSWISISRQKTDLYRVCRSDTECCRQLHIVGNTHWVCMGHLLVVCRAFVIRYIIVVVTHTHTRGQYETIIYFWIDVHFFSLRFVHFIFPITEMQSNLNSLSRPEMHFVSKLWFIAMNIEHIDCDLFELRVEPLCHHMNLNIFFFLMSIFHIEFLHKKSIEIAMVWHWNLQQKW